MDSPLLTTKLYFPRPRPNLVPRPHLIGRLEEGLELEHRLTLVSAPAGFGKTTLIGEWLYGGDRPVAWVTVEEGDNDPFQFLSYLIAAFQQVDERIGQTAQRLLQSPQLPPPQSLLTSLINDITEDDIPLTLVLDDYHVITAVPVHQALQFLLENQPPSMHMVIGTREDPPLPLVQLRARGQMTEIRGRDLRFTAEEAAAFLSQTMGLSLPAEAVAALEARTEGWIAGLQLAALALQEERENTEAFVAAFAGDDRYIMDYLAAEVLHRQPEPIRDFLYRTAILDRMTAPLCEAMTGREDSQAILEQLEGANLFLASLDNRREWYRYHRLFAEVLRRRLTREAQEALHQRAVRWYEANGFVSQAVHHALAYAALSGDTGEAERLILLAAEETLHAGGLVTLGGWLDALPEERVQADGGLATYKGWVLVFTGDLSQAENYADAAEDCLQEADAAGIARSKVRLLRGLIALGQSDYETANELAAHALRGLEEARPHWQVVALWAVAEAQERAGRITEAIETLQTAHRVGESLGSEVFTAVVEMSLTSALNESGRRHEAIAVCEQAIERHTDEMGQSLPTLGLLFSRLGVLHYEANELDTARRCHERSLALSEHLAMGGYAAFSLGFSAPTLHALGETRTALATLRQARKSAPQGGLADSGWFDALEANIRLQQGDLPPVIQWAEAERLSPDDAPQFLHIEQHVAYSRLLLAQGRLEEAGRWLARLERFAKEGGLYRRLLSVHIHQALLAERLGDRPLAYDYLSRALRIAAPEGYYRAFLDEDTGVLALLAHVREAAPAFVDRLLNEARGGRPRFDAVERLNERLIEPLSERELEVLALIADGLSNREIADRLFIAVGTVKRHINHIYGKLGVGTRIQATVKARELQLLGESD
jgi:LuxR family maltose regulon positive regulatory protein